MKHFLLLVGALLCLSAEAQVIEIKGIRIGTSLEELKNRFPSNILVGTSNPNIVNIGAITIGGATAKDLRGLDLFMRVDGAGTPRVDQMIFVFPAQSFSDVKLAVQEKYRSLRCVSSEVSTRAGGRLPQTECVARDGGSVVLTLRHYADDIDSGLLTVTSPQAMSEGKKHIQEVKTDI